MTKNTMSVIGAGAWGTCIAKILGEKGYPVQLWCYEEKTASEINTTHQSERLPNITLPKEITASQDLQAVMSAGSEIIIALGSAHLSILDNITTDKNKPILCLTKGLASNEGSPFVSDHIKKSLNTDQLAVLSGPNLALEIAQEKPAASVIASDISPIAQLFQEKLSTSYLRLYRTTDTRGVEVGGILKNSIAIAAGVSDGLQLGNNAKAALITRGLHEIKRIGTFYGGHPDTFNGLSGLGDLMATCNSPLSRNWQFGHNLITKQITDIPSYIDTLPSITEGVRTTKLITSIANENQLSLPIITEVYNIIFNNKSPETAIQELMSRDLKEEE